MRTSILLVSVFLLSSISPILQVSNAKTPVDDKFDIIMMGNSYTDANQLSSNVDRMFDEFTYGAEIQALTGGGMRLDQHADNSEEEGHRWYNTLRDTEGLDYVILQDQSQVPSLPEANFNWQASKDGAVRIDRIVQQQDAEIIFFMTWGRKDGDDQNDWRNPDFLTMQSNLKYGYEHYAENASNAWIAPVGLAFKHIYDRIIDEGRTPEDEGTDFSELYSSDGSHPSRTGTYLATCVIYSTITGDECVGKRDGFGFDQSKRLMLQQAADATVFNETEYSYPWTDDPIDSIESNLSIELNQLIEEVEPGVSFPDAPIAATFIVRNEAAVDDEIGISVDTCIGWDILSSQSNVRIRTDASSPEITIKASYNEQQGSIENCEFRINISSKLDDVIRTEILNLRLTKIESYTIFSQVHQILASPREEGQFNITVANDGNTNLSLGLSLENIMAWNITLGKSVLNLAKGESQVVIVNWIAPNIASGEVNFTVSVVNGESNTKQTDSIRIEIQSTMDIRASLITDCLRINSTCISQVSISNFGDLEEIIFIEVDGYAPWLNVESDVSQLTLASGEHSVINIGLTNDQTAKGGQIGLWKFTVKDAAGLELDSFNSTVVSISYFDWDIIGLANQTSFEDDEWTYGLTVRNIGNTDDGLIVSLSSNDRENITLLSSEIVENVAPGQSTTIIFMVNPPDKKYYDIELSIIIEIESTKNSSQIDSHTEIITINKLKEEVQPIKTTTKGQTDMTATYTALAIMVGCILLAGVVFSLKRKAE